MKMRVCGSWLGIAGCLIGSLVDLDVCCEVWLASLKEAVLRFCAVLLRSLAHKNGPLMMA